MVAVVLVGAAASRAADVAETETFAANDVGTRIVTFVQRSGVAGFSCEVRRYPDHDACVFVLANRDTAPVRQVVRRHAPSARACRVGPGRAHHRRRSRVPPRPMTPDLPAAPRGGVAAYRCP
jgi:hypothetical protein